MHLSQCESSLCLGTRFGEPLHISSSVWFITIYGKKAKRAITYILLLVDHHFLRKKRLEEPLYTSCSVWIITFYGKKARRANTDTLFSADHHFIWVQG
jgi:hypothetical protein